MTIYDVHDLTTEEYKQFFCLSPAKKWMKDRIKLGHEVHGDKTKVYSDGEWIPCGEISLTSNNKTFIANSKMKQANY